MIKADANRLDSFSHKCLRRILKVHWPMRVLNDDIHRRAEIDQYASKTQAIEMDRSCATHGTKSKRTCGTDLGTKWEKEARTAEGDMEEDGEKRTRQDEINIMGHSYNPGQE